MRLSGAEEAMFDTAKIVRRMRLFIQFKAFIAVSFGVAR
jgi:hypothetical protein